jgi:hypothetical protein
MNGYETFFRQIIRVLYDGFFERTFGKGSKLEPL